MEFASATLSGVALGSTLTVLFCVHYCVKLALFTKNKVESEIKQAQDVMSKASELNQALAAKVELLEDAQRAKEFFSTKKG